MPQQPIQSERARDLKDMARLCQEAKADQTALDASIDLSSCLRLFSAALVQADRLSPENERIIRDAESMADTLARNLQVAFEAQRVQIDELARLLGLTEI